MSISAELGEQKEVSLEQGTIRYRERGSGEPIVFVHGLLVNGDLWRKVVPSLAGEFRCVTPDWPLGSHEVPLKSTADASPLGAAKLAADFLAVLDLGGVTLVGNDTGGALCQLVIANHPDRIGRLVLTNCDAYENFPPAVFRYTLPLVHIPGSVSLVARALNWGVTQKALFRPLAKTMPSQDVLDSYARPALENEGVRDDLARLLKNASGANKHTLAAAKTFPEFRKPVLIAWAPDDRFFTWKYAKRLKNDFPNARLECIENSRTFTPEDQPEKLAELIATFMRETKAVSA